MVLKNLIAYLNKIFPLHLTFSIYYFYSDGFWITIRRYSLSGAIIISFFLDRIRRNVRSFVGSMSLTVFLALSTSCVMSPAYCVVVVLSKEVLIGTPSLLVTITPVTPLCDWIL